LCGDYAGIAPSDMEMAGSVAVLQNTPEMFNTFISTYDETISTLNNQAQEINDADATATINRHPKLIVCIAFYFLVAFVCIRN